MAKRESISTRTRWKVLKRDNYTCQYCGQSAPDVVLHIDHITPVARGGRSTIDNLVTSCAKCNLGKSTDSTNDFSSRKIIGERVKELECELEKTRMVVHQSQVDYIVSKIPSTVLDCESRCISIMIERYGIDAVHDAAEYLYPIILSEGFSVNKFDNMCRVSKDAEKKKRNPKKSNFQTLKTLYKMIRA